MRVRLLVVGAFTAMAVAPGYIAWTTGVLPAPTQASAESDGPASSAAWAVASLAWPDGPLGLAATDTRVVWEQRGPNATVAGLWYYNVRTGRSARLLGRSSTGKSAGSPAGAGDLIVWAAWPGRRGDGPPPIQAYDAYSTRRWQVTAAGRHPSVTGATALWVEPAAGRGGDVIRGSNSITDEEYKITVDAHVRDVAGWKRWVAWIAVRGQRDEVWAGSFRNATRYRLAEGGTAVTIDRDRVAWAASVGRHSTAIVSWDRRSHRSTVLCRMLGATTSLSLSRHYAVWVTTREATGPQVWAYDFRSGKAYPVNAAGGRQVSPVIVAGSVYWADDRSGHWELYTRSLQQ